MRYGSRRAIAENAGLGWTTINKIFPKLVKEGIVIQTRKIGRAKLYRLNLKNPIVQGLIRFDEVICSEFGKGLT